jgi:hypothetical protein
MPAGIEYGNVASYVAFAVVKAGAYTAYVSMLHRRFQIPHNSVLVGTVRTAIGMAVGGAYFVSVSLPTGDPPMELLGLPLYWLSLVPLRVLEWLVLLRLFYRERLTRRQTTLSIVWGLVVSYAADVPAVLGWIAFGGLWIC